MHASFSIYLAVLKGEKKIINYPIEIYGSMQANAKLK